MVMKLIKKGAEADIYQTTWQNSKSILKIRKVKNYRNSTLDSKIRKQRTIKESQILSHVKSFGVPTPLVYFVNLKDTSITNARNSWSTCSRFELNQKLSNSQKKLEN